ncbi:hypothetical protein [Priestia megaterium]|nr:hypothetical protein [Priestia megaterium]
MKVARTVLTGGKDGDYIKLLPIGTIRVGNVPYDSSSCPTDCE